MVPELLVLAIEYSRAPLRYPYLLDHARPLPACFDNLVSALGGAMVPARATATAAALGTTEPLLRAALLVFLRQVMVHAQADHYRVLGLTRTASPESIAAHYHAMVGLFHPDRADPQGRDRSVADTARINRAYRALRDPAARSRYDRELAKAALPRRIRPRPLRASRPVRWIPRRYRVAGARNLLVGGAGLLTAGALLILFAEDRQTLRMRPPDALARPPATGTVLPAAPAAPAATAARVAAARPATAPVASAQDIVERFRRHFAAGDLQGILLLLADDARVATLGGTAAGNDGADFYEATLKKALRLTDLRLERDDNGRLVASGGLQRPTGRAADTDGATEPAGEIRLELAGADAGYRISALLYRIDLKTPEPRN